MARELDLCFENAKKIQQELGDKFCSIEHLLLAVSQDNFFGRQALQEIFLDYDKLLVAVKQIRGTT